MLFYLFNYIFFLSVCNYTLYEYLGADLNPKGVTITTATYQPLLSVGQWC